MVQPSHTDQVKKYFDNTGDYLEKSFGVRIRALAVRDLLRQRSNLSILDVGCGNGMISLQFAEQSNRLVLIDLSDSMLALARQNTPAGLEQGVTYLNLDFHEYHPAHLFDLVLCIGVIAHVSSVETALGKLASLLKPHGECIIQFTDQEKGLARLSRRVEAARGMLAERRAYALNLVSASEMLSLCRLQGLNLVDQRRYFGLLPGMGRLPDKFLYAYQSYTLHHPRLALFGDEVIALFKKAG